MKNQDLINNLRKRIEDYKSSPLYNDKVLKQDILSIEIAVSLFEISAYCGRAIEKTEKYWFDGGFYIAYDMTGEWSDISKMYGDLVQLAADNNMI